MQFAVALERESYGFGEDLAEFCGTDVRIVEPLVQFLQLDNLLPQQQCAQFGQFVGAMVELRVAFQVSRLGGHGTSCSGAPDWLGPLLELFAFVL